MEFRRAHLISLFNILVSKYSKRQKKELPWSYIVEILTNAKIGRASIPVLQANSYNEIRKTYKTCQSSHGIWGEGGT